jgi:hypothetical protein
MRELIAAVVGLGLIFYVMRDEKAPNIGPQKLIEGFEPELIQSTLNLIQERDPDVYPIDTVYFQKKDGGGQTYIGRFMFLNTKGFYGVQYDIETDGTTLTSMTKSVPPEFQNPFGGYSLAEKYKNISKVSAPVPDMKKIHVNLKTENMFGFYQR